MLDNFFLYYWSSLNFILVTLLLNVYGQKAGIIKSHFHDDNLLITVMNLFAAGKHWDEMGTSAYSQISKDIGRGAWVILDLKMPMDRKEWP